MKVFCRCGNNCIKPRTEVLKDFKSLYNPCENCEDVRLKKFTPLARQVDMDLLDANFKKCKCGKRHLDVVMAHILKIMIDEGVKDANSNLRDVCVPLVTPAFPLENAPYLFEDSMVILSPDVDTKCAQRILKEVPEVKGVLKGNPRDTVGIKDSNTNPVTYKLLGGCDLRCDIVYTPWGILCINKYQGEIHIELPHPLSPKIQELEKALSKHDGQAVLDCTCGPGTLGLSALFAGARKVVFNDVWYPACQATLMNLESNGFSLVSTGKSEGLIASGDNFEVHCSDINDLKHHLSEKFDVCLVDVFPGVDETVFKKAVKDICREVIVI